MNATCQRRFGRSTCVEVHRSLNHIPLSCLVRRCRFAYYSVKPHIDTHNRHRPPFLLSLLCNHVVVGPHRHLADTRVRYMAVRNSHWGISTYEKRPSSLQLLMGRSSKQTLKDRIQHHAATGQVHPLQCRSVQSSFFWKYLCSG